MKDTKWTFIQLLLCAPLEYQLVLAFCKFYKGLGGDVVWMSQMRKQREREEQGEHSRTWT